MREGFGYPQLRECIIRVRNLFLYILARRQIGYLALHTRGQVAPGEEPLARSVANRTSEVIVFQMAVERA